MVDKHCRNAIHCIAVIAKHFVPLQNRYSYKNGSPVQSKCLWVGCIEWNFPARRGYWCARQVMINGMETIHNYRLFHQAFLKRMNESGNLMIFYTIFKLSLNLGFNLTFNCCSKIVIKKTHSD